jgi:excisionase family DNA binding protein
MRTECVVVREDVSRTGHDIAVELVRTVLIRGLMSPFGGVRLRDASCMTQHRTEEYAETRTRLLTIAELADLLNVERKTVYRLGIPYVVVGARRRFRLEDVDAYLEARKVAAG